MPRDVAAAKTEDGSADETEQRNENGGDERLSQRPPILPSPFVADWIARVAAESIGARRALDLATGRGRHLVALGRAGFEPYGVDNRFEALESARAASAGAGIFARLWCADLTVHPLPAARFDLIVVSRYLQRVLFDAIRRALTPGGVLIYETFTTAQRALGTGPRSPDHLLEPGELRSAFVDCEMLFYEEVSAPEALARLVARTPA
ncbi:MAG TPA: methyltransferase domain-containing protein [Vicinamibacterales bacterium]|nr:methyltransferase domain-containing protein [Vicinamibacterales bacterium]